MADTIRIKRRVSGVAGPPATLANAELAYNEVNDVLYYGKGDDGAGQSTSRVAIGGPGSFQPLDADLTAIAALTGMNVIYYRSAANTWAAVTIGSGLSFSGGTLAATGGGGTGNVSNVGTPTNGQLAQWTDATHIQGIDLSALGLAPLNSPIFTGDPRAPTPATADNDTSIATTEFVKAQGYELSSNKGVANGYASLDATIKVPAAQLPSYVDDVVEYANLAAFPATGSVGIIYVALDTNKIYRWSGSVYIEISPSPGSTDAVPEGSLNLYYTEARVSANTTVSSKAPLASPIFTGDPQAPTPTTADNDTSIATTAFVKAQGYATTAALAGYQPLDGDLTALAALTGTNTIYYRSGVDTWSPVTMGGNMTFAGGVLNSTASATAPAPQAGRFSYVSATQVMFSPYNGDRIRIAGTDYAIPAAGITAANTGVYVNGIAGQNLAASTHYFVYVFNNGGTPTIDFSTTTHATSTTAGNVGVEIKSGDNTRTLIGMVYTSASGQFQDSDVNRYVASWFNRRLRRSINWLASTASTTSASLAMWVQTNFLAWANDTIIWNLFGSANCSLAGVNAILCVGFGAISAEPQQTFFTGTANVMISLSGLRTMTASAPTSALGLWAVGGGATLSIFSGTPSTSAPSPGVNMPSGIQLSMWI